MYRCPMCGGFVAPNFKVCPYCGYNFLSMLGVAPGEEMREIRRMRRNRVLWRLLFVVAELFSFSISLVLCWLFARVLDTDIFKRHTYLIVVVWFWVAYKIYHKFLPKIR